VNLAFAGVMLTELGELTQKSKLLLTMPPVVTVTGPLVAVAGTVAMMEELLQLLTVAETPLKVTVPVAPKLEPIISTEVAAGPEFGVNDAIYGGGPNVAVTVCAELIVTMQVPVPVQSPLQPVNTRPASAVGVRLTEVPVAKLVEHVPPQSIPAGVDTSDPPPALLTESMNAVGVPATVKVVLPVTPL